MTESDLGHTCIAWFQELSYAYKAAPDIAARGVSRAQELHPAHPARPAARGGGAAQPRLAGIRRRPRLLYCLLVTPYVREKIIGCANGSTVNMLKPAGLEIPRFVCPPAELTIAFEDLAKAIHQRIEQNIQQAEELGAIRDTLLPRLISGKVRIPEAPCPTA